MADKVDAAKAAEGGAANDLPSRPKQAKQKPAKGNKNFTLEVRERIENCSIFRLS